jgi:hypothetical protein
VFFAVIFELGEYGPSELLLFVLIPETLSFFSGNYNVMIWD